MYLVLASTNPNSVNIHLILYDSFTYSNAANSLEYICSLGN